MDDSLEDCLAELIELMDDATDGERLAALMTLLSMYCQWCGSATLPCNCRDTVTP
jgi:hypothetical protein